MTYRSDLPEWPTELTERSEECYLAILQAADEELATQCEALYSVTTLEAPLRQDVPPAPQWYHSSAWREIVVWNLIRFPRSHRTVITNKIIPCFWNFPCLGYGEAVKISRYKQSRHLNVGILWDNKSSAQTWIFGGQRGEDCTAGGGWWCPQTDSCKSSSPSPCWHVTVRPWQSSNTSTAWPHLNNRLLHTKVWIYIFYFYYIIFYGGVVSWDAKATWWVSRIKSTCGNAMASYIVSILTFTLNHLLIISLSHTKPVTEFVLYLKVIKYIYRTI